ncbi:hypothetical protein BC827DRAFT_1158667 [Russula dissimulans]|nr:hypothetical protein BC827DRAFT_1158667 [Russula dissimulans]
MCVMRPNTDLSTSDSVSDNGETTSNSYLDDGPCAAQPSSSGIIKMQTSEEELNLSSLRTHPFRASISSVSHYGDVKGKVALQTGGDQKNGWLTAGVITRYAVAKDTQQEGGFRSRLRQVHRDIAELTQQPQFSLLRLQSEYESGDRTSRHRINGLLEFSERFLASFPRVPPLDTSGTIFSPLQPRRRTKYLKRSDGKSRVAGTVCGTERVPGTQKPI